MMCRCILAAPPADWIDGISAGNVIYSDSHKEGKILIICHEITFRNCVTLFIKLLDNALDSQGYIRC